MDVDVGGTCVAVGCAEVAVGGTGVAVAVLETADVGVRVAADVGVLVASVPVGVLVMVVDTTMTTVTLPPKPLP